MNGNRNNTGKNLYEGICTHLQSILQLINVDFNYGTPRVWKQDSKWSIAATGEDPVANAHTNKINLSYDVTGRCDVKISQPKKKLEWISSRLIWEV